MVNMMQIMKQAQAKMNEYQDQLSKKEFVGKAGGSMVEVRINGKGEMLSVKIDEGLIKPEDKEILEDLIIAAFKDAKQKCEEDNQNSMSSMFGGSLPGGFKLPF